MRDISIFQIPVSKIEPHPQNPRKDLGDLTELCDSIQRNGIMQNLTVVPLDDDMNRFRCVIGHRRLAAAKKVGLFAVPATIAQDMDEREQLATMIAENMQREDLTIPEQVGAVQLMLDLGEDFESIADRTGLAKSTVKQRAKIAGLTDNATLTKAWEHGVTLLQIEQIAKIEDPERRAALWAKSTEKYFDREINAALYEQKCEKFERHVRKLLEDAGIQEAEKGQDNRAKWIANIGNYNEPKTVEDIKKMMDRPGNAKYCYTFSYGSFTLYVYYDDGTEQEEQDHYDALTRWKIRVKELEKGFQDREKDFIEDASKRAETDFRRPIEDYLKIVLNECEKESRIWLSNDMRIPFKEAPTFIGKLFVLSVDNVRIGSIMDYNGERLEDRAKTMIKLLEMLKAEGYEPTDLEYGFFTGSHPIFEEKPEKEDEK